METILTVKEESMIAVADAVRDKSGVEGSLSFPNGMVDAINSIETTVMSVQVDNQTIVEEDGVIRTAIGGGYTEATPAETVYENNENIQARFDNIYQNDDGINFNINFTLPNWTPLGEEYSNVSFNVSWIEYPNHNDLEYCVECSATAYFYNSDTRITINLNDVQNSQLVYGYLDNTTGILCAHPSLMPGIYYISNFRIEAPEIPGEVIPIGSEFIPQEIYDGISNAENWAWDAYSQAEEANWRIDYLEQNGGGGVSDAASVSFNDEVAQIGATTVQEAIEKLADEAASSTSVQEQIDENNIDLLKDINTSTSGFDITATPKNASAYVWENNSCPWSFNEKVIYWDMDNMDIHGAYTDPNSNYDIKKMDYGKSTFKKGHYYACKSVGAVDMRTFAGKYGDRNLQLYYGISTSASLKTSPITDSSVCLWYGRDYICYAFKDITHLLLADKVVSEDRVSEMITEALGVIENGTY